MEDKFNEQYLRFVIDKKHILIPNSTKYNEMVEIMQKTNEGATRKSEKYESNLQRNYFLRIEQNKQILFHQGHSSKENAQRVIKQEELFRILNDSHKKLGHAGCTVMWKDLRDCYGISK